MTIINNNELTNLTEELLYAIEMEYTSVDGMYMSSSYFKGEKQEVRVMGVISLS